MNKKSLVYINTFGKEVLHKKPLILAAFYERDDSSKSSYSKYIKIANTRFDMFLREGCNNG